VQGVQRAQDGSLSLKGEDGASLRYAPPLGDKRVSSWTYSAYEGINGVFAHEKYQKHFRAVEPEDCGDGPE
jgi:hypothetical protein